MLIDSWPLWIMTAVVFLTACAGKGLACWAAARLSGARPRDALAIATLMNARGMVELILVNLGLQRGLITPTLFAILVLMAIGTTVMTGPVFSLIWERKGEPAVEPGLAADRAPRGACRKIMNTLLVGRLRRQKAAGIREPLRAKRGY
jgi:Kef-type K+ transport system membrane component KefB